MEYAWKAMDDIARCIPHLEQFLEKRKGKFVKIGGEHMVMIDALLADQHGEVQYVRDDGLSKKKKYMFSLDGEEQDVPFEPGERYIAFYFCYWPDSGPFDGEMVYLCHASTGEVKGFWRTW